jgi:chemotaxis protein CheD
MASNSLAVGLGEIKVSRDRNDVLVAFGLGSCVGISMYDPVTRVAGLLHAVLPERINGAEPLSPKYVDSGVMELISQMINAGANRGRLVARMAGGANMLITPGLSKTFDIGTRNVTAAHAKLSELNIKIVGEETGGNAGRTVRMYIADGRMTIRTMGNQEREV